MKVLVTGGTGFVGSHIVAVLVKQNHRVRLLARAHDRVERALVPHGCAVSEVVLGDVTNQRTVSAAVADCEAVIHAANVFSFDPRQHGIMSTVNEQGTELVLTEAARVGLDPIVHVSSYAALLPTAGALTADSEVGMPEPAYSRSKAGAERIARRLQSDGVPVVTIYPGSVWGPHDPNLGESARLAQGALKGRYRLLNDGLLPITDARDVAVAVAALMEPGRGPRRYFVVGHNPSFRDLIVRVGDLAGRNLWSIPVPETTALATGRIADWARSRFGINSSLSFEGPWLVANATEADSSPIVEEFGIEFTPLDETLTDTVRWLHEAGHITKRQAGTLAAQAPGFSSPPEAVSKRPHRTGSL